MDGGLALVETDQLVVLAPLQCLSPSDWRLPPSLHPAQVSGLEVVEAERLGSPRLNPACTAHGHQQVGPFTPLAV